MVIVPGENGFFILYFSAATDYATPTLHYSKKQLQNAAYDDDARGGTPYDILYGEALPEKGTFPGFGCMKV